MRQVLLPLFGVVAYLWAVQLFGTSRGTLLLSENGIIELCTAGFFLLAAGLALRLILSRDRKIPRRYRVLFLLFALAACFVALEETSYGQHIFGWQTPDFFARYSTKNELNLHNLCSDRLSNVFRNIGNFLFPTCCIVLPLVYSRGKRQFDPNHWSYYLLPRMELVAVVLLSQSMTPLDEFLRWLVGCHMLVRPGEMQELYWSVAAFYYVCVIERRVTSDMTSCDVLPFRPIRANPLRIRKAA
jgi:hypothetical protein